MIKYFLIIVNYHFPFETNNSGLAIKIEEYVPTIVPIIITKTKYFKDSGPKRKRANRTNTKVSEVLIERVIV